MNNHMRHFNEQDTHIVNSLLDLDFYKLTTGQLAFKKYANVPVKFAFKCRTKIRLADVIDEKDLRFQLDHVRGVKLSFGEEEYLRSFKNSDGQRIFSEEYVLFLRHLRLPDYHLEVADGNFILEFSGPWAEVTYWETISLSIMNELYYRALLANMDEVGRIITYSFGEYVLQEKIKILRLRPDVIFTEFGTRRRFSKKWQEYVVRNFMQLLPRTQFVGTSNVNLARRHGIVPKGTMPHEPFMIMGGIMYDQDEGGMVSHNQVLKDWWEEYGYDFSVALTDTYGTDFFFRDMAVDQAEKWKGLRQDSGDPIIWGEKTIKFYDSLGINPRKRVGFYSDGLDLTKMIGIVDHFKGRMPSLFGWGTNATNDLGIPALSLVVKPVEANGHGLVKLSDNLAKATGTPRDVERIKNITGYRGDFYEECKY